MPKLEGPSTWSAYLKETGRRLMSDDNWAFRALRFGFWSGVQKPAVDEATHVYLDKGWPTFKDKFQGRSHLTWADLKPCLAWSAAFHTTASGVRREITKVMENWTSDQIKDFLRFATASSALPGRDSCNMTLEYKFTSTGYPASHTCYRTVDFSSLPVSRPPARPVTWESVLKETILNQDFASTRVL